MTLHPDLVNNYHGGTCEMCSMEEAHLWYEPQRGRAKRHPLLKMNSPSDSRTLIIKPCKLLDTSSLNSDNRREGRPSYLFVDFKSASTTSETNSRSPFSFILCERSKLKSLNFRRTLYATVVICAFLLGLSLGAVIPFPFVPKKLSKLSDVKEFNNVTKISLSNNITTLKVVSKEGLFKKQLLNGVFWSDFVEEALPSGFEDGSDHSWKKFVKNRPIVRVEEGCGRMQNRLVTFSDGTKACCRYRQNTDQIQGEIFSYFLGRLLKLRNLVPSTLVTVNTSDVQWLPVKEKLGVAQWKEGHAVVMTQFVDNLRPALIPASVINYTAEVLALTGIQGEGSSTFNFFYSPPPADVGGKIDVGWVEDLKQAVETAQWSDLLIFDYLTANLDRVVNNLYNLQWNRMMLKSPAHNLARVQDLLLFLDNESGLLHGYRLLDKYEPYHALLLDGLCFFRKSTIKALTMIRRSNLKHLLNKRLPANDILPTLPDKNIQILNQRVDRVLRQVELCQQRLR